MNDTIAPSTQADALRVAADILAAHPDLPAPYVTCGGLSGGRLWCDVNWQLVLDADDLTGQKAAAATIVRTVGGTWDKQELGDRFTFEQDRDGVALKVIVARDAVCERVVVGIEQVTFPAVEAQPERVEEVEVVEWRCAPLLADAQVSA